MRYLNKIFQMNFNNAYQIYIAIITNNNNKILKEQDKWRITILKSTQKL